jgi:hypothetical protein
MFRFFCKFVFLFPFFLYAEKIDINTQIVSVRVYQGAANITRQGDFLPQGKSGFRIKNLGMNIIDSSIAIRFLPENSGIKIKRINIIPQVEKTFKDEDLKKLTEREEILSRKLKILTDELEAIKKQRNFISSLTPQKKDTNREVSTEISMNTNTWSIYQKMLTNILDENSSAEWKLLQELDDTREELLVVESKMDYFSKSSSLQHKDIEIETNSDSAQPVKVFLDYIINDAYWYPRYEVKVDTVAKTNQISFFALVRNNTGEDWRNVNLAFSAADLNKKLDLPSVDEWKISYYETPQEQSISRGYAQADARKIKNIEIEESLKKRNDDAKPEIAKPVTQTSNSIGGNTMLPADRTRLQTTTESDGEMQQSNDLDKKNESPKKKKVESYKAKDILSQGNIKSRSNETESNLTEFKNVFENQQSYYTNRDFGNAILTGKQAMEKLSLINPKFQSELSPARKEIEETVRKSALMQANSKITTGLVSPLESSGGYDYRYSAAAVRETLLSDNSFNRVLISRETLPTILSYETAPVKIKSVFLTSNSISRNKEPLLKGPLDIYSKEDYITTSVLKNTATGEDLKFDLGPEEDIEVERKEEIFREKKGFFSGQNSITTTITVRLKNRKKEKASILVVDRIPYTNDPQAKIETKNLPNKNELSRAGILKYPVEVSPGETKEIKYEYKILYPEESRLKEKQREEE